MRMDFVERSARERGMNQQVGAGHRNDKSRVQRETKRALAKVGDHAEIFRALSIRGGSRASVSVHTYTYTHNDGSVRDVGM